MRCEYESKRCLTHSSPLINKNLSEFQESWNNHSLSSEGSRTPYQLLVEGLCTSDLDNIESEIDVDELTNAHVPVPRLPCSELSRNLEAFQTSECKEIVHHSY